MANIYRNIGASVKDTGGIWDQLDAQMSRQPARPAQAGMGIWGQIIVPTSVGGMWDQFDNETMYLSRESAKQAHKLDVWRESADETLILPKEGLLPI
jgi:hypothetical protein